MFRAFMFTMGFLMALMMIPAFAQAGEEASCVVKTNDIGTINTTGKSWKEAFAKASEQCFDRYEAKYKRSHHGENLDEEHGISIIDQCANLKCG